MDMVMDTMDMDIIMARGLLMLNLQLKQRLLLNPVMATMVMDMVMDITDMDTIMAKGRLRLMLSLDMATMVMVMDMDMDTMAMDMVMDMDTTMDKHHGLS